MDPVLGGRRIGIKELYDFDFGIFHDLRYLNLKHNMIKKIQSKNFNSVELKKLILDHNLIEKIDKNTFIHCINLDYLSLRTNSIKFLDKKVKPTHLGDYLKCHLTNSPLSDIQFNDLIRAIRNQEMSQLETAYYGLNKNRGLITSKINNIIENELNHNSSYNKLIQTAETSMAGQLPSLSKIFLLAIKKPMYLLYLGDHTTDVTLPSSLPLLSTDKLLKKGGRGKMSKSNLTRYIDLLKPLSLCLSKADFPTKSKSTSKLQNFPNPQS